MSRGRAAVLAVLALLLLLTALSAGGCRAASSSGGAPAAGSDGAKTVVVPDVIGLYYGDAAIKLQDAGLQPIEVNVHGPIDDDAGEIGKIYRQTPKAGTKVAPGTKVELRHWWESQ